jgi:hypothetical protein
MPHLILVPSWCQNTVTHHRTLVVQNPILSSGLQVVVDPNPSQKNNSFSNTTVSGQLKGSTGF